MGERRYGVGSRGRSPSPRRPPPRSRDFSPLRHRRSPPPRHPPPRSRDFSPLRHRKFSPYHRRETEEYSREAETSRRIEKRDHMDRDSGLRAPRFTEYDNGDRDRDGYVFGGREFRSPGRTEKRDNFGGLVSFSDYGDGAKGKYENGVSVGRLRRSYDEDIYHGDSSSMKFQPDHLLDGPSRPDHLRVKLLLTSVGFVILMSLAVARGIIIYRIVTRIHVEVYCCQNHSIWIAPSLFP